MAAGKSGGKADSASLNAFSPPADAAIATTSKAGVGR